MTDGCTTVNNNDGTIECTCNHLTSFAVLADVSIDGASSSISANDSRALSIITYVPPPPCANSNGLCSVVLYSALLSFLQSFA
jgi:hypothetical protein